MGTREAFASIGASVTAMLAAQLATAGRGWGVFTPVLVGLLAAMAGAVITKLVAPPSLPPASG